MVKLSDVRTSPVVGMHRRARPATPGKVSKLHAEPLAEPLHVKEVVYAGGNGSGKSQWQLIVRIPLGVNRAVPLIEGPLQVNGMTTAD